MSIKLTMTCGPYDRAQALIDGTVKPEGIDHRQALTTRKFRSGGDVSPKHTVYLVSAEHRLIAYGL